MSTEKNVWVIVPAAGVGRRFSSSVPKQFTPFEQDYIFVKGLKTLLENPLITGVTVVTTLPETSSVADESFRDFLRANTDRLLVVPGRDERFTSVKAGLEALLARTDWAVSEGDLVLVHDGVRPCLAADDLASVIQALLKAQKSTLKGGVLLARPVSDTVKRVDQKGLIMETLDRQHLWQAQTPQGASVGQLLKAYEQWRASQHDLVPTDEAQMLSHLGVPMQVVQAQHANPKLTFPDDLPLIYHLMRNEI